MIDDLPWEHKCFCCHFIVRMTGILCSSLFLHEVLSALRDKWDPAQR